MVLSIRSFRGIPDFGNATETNSTEERGAISCRLITRLMTSDDEEVRLSAARAWHLGRRDIKTVSDSDLVDHWESAHAALSLARIECHYL